MAVTVAVAVAMTVVIMTTMAVAVVVAQRYLPKAVRPLKLLHSGFDDASPVDSLLSECRRN